MTTTNNALPQRNGVLPPLTQAMQNLRVATPFRRNGKDEEVETQQQPPPTHPLVQERPNAVRNSLIAPLNASQKRRMSARTSVVSITPDTPPQPVSRQVTPPTRELTQAELLNSTAEAPLQANPPDWMRAVVKGEWVFMIYVDNCNDDEIREANYTVKNMRENYGLYPCKCFFITNTPVEYKAKAEYMKYSIGLPTQYSDFVPDYGELRLASVPNLIDSGIEAIATAEMAEVQEAVATSQSQLLEGGKALPPRFAVAVYVMNSAFHLTETVAVLKKVLVKDNNRDKRNLRPALIVFFDLYQADLQKGAAQLLSWLNMLPSVEIFTSRDNIRLTSIYHGTVMGLNIQQLRSMLAEQFRLSESIAPVGFVSSLPDKTFAFPPAAAAALPLATIDTTQLIIPARVSKEDIKRWAIETKDHPAWHETAGVPIGKSRRDELGRGSFGVVYQALYMGMWTAAKVVKGLAPRPDQTKSAGRVETEREAFEESVALASLRHPHIVSLLGIGFMEELHTAELQQGVQVQHVVANLVLVQELLSHNLRRWSSIWRGENITSQPDDVQQLTPVDRLSALRDVCIGLAYMHQRGYIHGDLKPENILYDSVSKKAKIADLGHARLFSNLNVTRTVSTQATLDYNAPEAVAMHLENPRYLRGKVYRESEKLDVFSIGVIMTEVLSGRKGFGWMWQQPRSFVMDVITPHRDPKVAAKQFPPPRDADFIALVNALCDEETPIPKEKKELKKADGSKEVFMVTRPDLAYIYANALCGTTFDALVTADPPLKSALSESMLMLIRQCLAFNPDQRPTMMQIVEVLNDEIRAVESGPA